MPNLNKVQLMGNLTTAPEIRYTPKGTAICELRFAITRNVKDGDEWKIEVTIVDVTLFGKQAEIAGTYLHKGRSAFIEGRLQLDSWDDKQSGQKRTKLKVIGENLQLLEKSQAGGEPRRESAPRFDDDIPF